MTKHVTSEVHKIHKFQSLNSNILQGKRVYPEHVQPPSKPTRHGNMFWAAFHKGYRTKLYPLEGHPLSKRGGVTARRILEVLKEALPEILEPGMFFIQDNAPTHMAAENQDWLEEWNHERGVSVIKCPASSPDLNPIENLWKLLKNGICEARPNLSDLPKTDQLKQELIDTAVKVCEELEEKVFDAEINSMPYRMRAVVEAKGWYTKY